MDCCDRFTLTYSGRSFCRYYGVSLAYDDVTMIAVWQMETLATTAVLPPSARDKRLQQSSKINASRSGAAAVGYGGLPFVRARTLPVSTATTAPVLPVVLWLVAVCRRPLTRVLSVVRV